LELFENSIIQNIYQNTVKSFSLLGKREDKKVTNEMLLTQTLFDCNLNTYQTV